jgi:hypothetical protein
MYIKISTNPLPITAKDYTFPPFLGSLAHLAVPCRLYIGSFQVSRRICVVGSALDEKSHLPRINHGGKATTHDSYYHFQVSP